MAAVETGLHSERRQDTAALRDIGLVAVMGTATLGGLALRWLNLQRWSLWWDEGFTVWASGLSVGRIIPFARTDNQAPLYYLLQHYWNALFGNSEFALRALSALFGTLALALFYFLAKKVLNDGAAVALAFWLFAFSVKQIWYSREARVYEAASFLAIVALYALVLFLEKRSAWAFLVVVLSSALSLYLHNLMCFYFLALDLVWLIYPSERSWTRRIPEILIANLGAGLLYLPWAVGILSQVSAVTSNLYWVPRPTLESLAATITGIAGFEVASLSLFVERFLPLPSNALEGVVWVAMSVLYGGLLVGGFWRVSRVERRKNLCFLAYCLLPIFLVFILGQKMPLYIDRVFTTSSIAVPIIFALPLAGQKGPRGKLLYSLLGLALAGVTALSSLRFVRSGEGAVKNGEDWRGVIAAVLAIPAKDRLVVFVPPPGEIFFDYYSQNFPAADTRVDRTGLHEDFRSRFPPPKSRVINTNDVDRLRMLVESHQYFEIDLVMTHEVDPHGLIVNYLDRHFIRQEELPPSGAKIRIIPFRAVPQP